MLSYNIYTKHKDEMQEDDILKEFVNEVFAVYDRNRTGYLDPMELANFFNDLFTKLNDPRRFTQQQAIDIFRSMDKNYDGKI